MKNEALFNKEFLLKNGFEYVNDGGDKYYQLVLGDNYFNSDYIYAEEVKGQEDKFQIFDGRTHEKLKNYEVEAKIGNKFFDGKDLELNDY